jgi:hypothetical protein
VREVAPPPSSKAADSTAFDHAGGVQSYQSWTDYAKGATGSAGGAGMWGNWINGVWNTKQDWQPAITECQCNSAPLPCYGP